MKTKIKFPFVDSFADYHDIIYKADELNEIFVTKIKYKEIAFDGDYWGLFYVGKMPSRKTIHKLLVDMGWEKNLGFSEFKM
jgi:hypothetical protein